MPWSVELNSELGVIETVYRGNVTNDDIESSLVEAKALASKDGPSKFLTMLVDADLKLSTLDLYSIPDEWSEMEFDRRNRLAIVAPDSPELQQDLRFHENTSRNRGWQVQIFLNREGAVDWLLG
jgi:hypothetical protein